MLVKSITNNAPYRRINLGILGAIPDLKLTTLKPASPEAKNLPEFTIVERKRNKKRGKHVEKNRLFNRIERFINTMKPLSDCEVTVDDDK